MLLYLSQIVNSQPLSFTAFKYWSRGVVQQAFIGTQKLGQRAWYVSEDTVKHIVRPVIACSESVLPYGKPCVAHSLHRILEGCEKASQKQV